MWEITFKLIVFAAIARDPDPPPRPTFLSVSGRLQRDAGKTVGANELTGTCLSYTRYVLNAFRPFYPFGKLVSAYCAKLFRIPFLVQPLV